MHAWVCMPTHSHATTHTQKGGKRKEGERTLRRLRQANHEFKATLDYITRSCL